MPVQNPGTQPNQIPDDALTLTTDDGPDTEERLGQIRQRFTIHQTFWSNIFNMALEDDKFVAGEQWPDEIRKERQEDRRPILTYNLFPSFTRQITNRIRQERPQIKVTPVESNRGPDPRLSNLQGTKDYAMAEVYTGLIRNIEHVSRADQCYDTATKHAVDHGFGWFYLMNSWSKLDPFVQELVIHRVKNAYTIYMDPSSQEADYRDAQDAFMFVMMDKKTYDKKYPDTPFTEFAGTTMGSTYLGWYDSDNIRVCQYFFIEHKDDEVALLSNGKTVYLSKVGDILDELKHETGIHILKNDDGTEMRRKVKRPVCMWQKMTARDILEGPLELPFSAIPIFPVFGEEMMVDGQVRYESAIRHAKDAQRSYNYWRTAAAETVALTPRAPIVATERQMAGHEEVYESANVRNHPFLPYNHQDGVPPPQRQFNPQPAAAELQNAVQDGVDMQTIIGLHDASLGRESNEKSGKAIIARQNAGATSTFQFPDNLGRALEQMGRLIVEAVPQLYDTQRIIRIRLPDDTEDFVEINTTVKDQQSGETVLVADIAYGKYDVRLETGPSYATQRQEAADLQMELLKVLGPDRAANIVHLIVRNLGVPGSDEVAAVLRKMLPDALKSEDEKMADLPKGVTMDEETGQPMNEDGTPYEPPMTPELAAMQKQQQIDEAQAQADQATADAKVATAEADKVQAQAKIKQAEADLAKYSAEMQEMTGQADGQAQAGMMQQIEQVIQEALAEHELNTDAHKETTQEMISDAVIDALKRVRGFVDRKVKAGDINGMVTPAPGAPATPATPETPAAGNQAQAPLAVNLNLEPKPDRITFEYDADGNIVAGVPVYETETEEET